MKNRVTRAIINEFRKVVERNRARKQVRFLTAESQRAAYVIGSPVYGNYGDSAILLAQMAFLRELLPEKQKIIEITYSEYYQYRDALCSTIKKDSPIFCMGGGNMGNQWVREEQLRFDVMKDFPQNRIIVFPQTVFYSEKGDPSYTPERSREIYQNCRKLTLTAREKRSYSLMREYYPGTNILLAPDIVFWMTKERFGAVSQERNGVMFCCRNDVERAMTEDTWTLLKHEVSRLGYPVLQTDTDRDIKITKENRRDEVRQKLQEFCAVRLVVTDRLHGMIFAALAGTPCIAFGNYNDKVRGTYEWIRYLPYIKYAETVDEAIRFLPELLTMDDCIYDNTPLLTYYDELKKVVIEACR